MHVHNHCHQTAHLHMKKLVQIANLCGPQSKTKGSQKITFAEFEKALELVAEKKVTALQQSFCF